MLQFHLEIRIEKVSNVSIHSTTLKIVLLLIFFLWMTIIHGICGSDVPSNSRCAKVSSRLLPQEMLFERFAESLNMAHPSHPLEILSAWSSEEIVYNDRGEIIQLLWSHKGMNGSILWGYIPATVEFIDFGWNEFNGRIDAKNLPHGIRVLDIQQNCF